MKFAQYVSMNADVSKLFYNGKVYEMQGTRKSWQSGQDKMLCTDRPH